MNYPHSHGYLARLREQATIARSNAIYDENEAIYTKMRNLPESLQREYEAIKTECFGLNERHPQQAAWDELVRRYPDITSQDQIQFENDHEPIAYLKMDD